MESPFMRIDRFSSLVLAGLMLAGPTICAAGDRPNVLFIIADDLGWRDVGFMGSDFYETPHLDRLASEGTVFTEAYAAAANCAPSRATVMSGQYTPRHRIFNVGTKPRGKAEHRRLEHIAGTTDLDPAIDTWPERLQAAGYATAAMGKWHLDRDPTRHGFDLNIGGTTAGGPPRGYYPPHPAPGLRDAPEDEYLTDTLAGAAEKFIRANRDRPWCLYLTFFAVHTPLQAKRELLPKYENKPPGELHDHAVMGTMVEAMDGAIGRVRAAIEEQGLGERTVIFFTSDNGGYGPATDMAPLKGYKGTYYEGGIRVPFVACWPGRFPSGREIDVPVSGVDIYPTVCDVTGVGLPDDQAMDGMSLTPLLTGEPGPEWAQRPLFWHFPAYLQSYPSVVDEQRDPLFRTRPCSVVRVGDLKLHQYFEDGALELYDLREDPGETRNLAESQPEKAEQMRKRLEAWRESIGAPVPTKPNAAFDAEAEAAARRRADRR